jgi:hypothetical protein
MPFVIVAALGVPLRAAPQDVSLAIGGESADGNRQQQSKPGFPPAEIRETKMVQLPDRQLKIHRIADPGLPDPRQKVPESLEWSQEQVEAFRNSPAGQRWKEQAAKRMEEEAKTTYLFICATVVDDRATLLRWWHGGNEYRAWSNSNWMVMAALDECHQGDRIFVPLLMSTGRVNSLQLAPNSPLRIPADLSPEPGTYRITQGDLTDREAYAGITALHELYRSDYAKLKDAYEIREQRTKEREAALRAKPAKKADAVLHIWKVDRVEKNTVGSEGGGK